MKCTFLALKARSNLTLQLDSDELRLRGERMLFQAYVNERLSLIFQLSG